LKNNKEAQAEKLFKLRLEFAKEKDRIEQENKKVSKDKKKPVLSWSDAARDPRFEFKDGEGFRNWYRKYKEKHGLLQPPSGKSPEKIIDDPELQKKTISINSDGTQSSERLIALSEEQSKDPDFLLQCHGYDSKSWELVSARNNIWNAYSKKDGILVLYSSKINVKPRKDISLEEIKESFAEFAKEYKPVHVNVCYEKHPEPCMVEIPICDLHLGKLGWLLEVGGNFDSKIAEEWFLYIINKTIQKIKHKQTEKILFPVGNDFFNTDTVEVTTTKGTRQDNDVRWKKMARKGQEILIKAIDSLLQVAPVEMFFVEANHDEMNGFWVCEYLKAWYRNNRNVIIDSHNPSMIGNDCSARKYVEYGNNLIGFTHGNAETKTNILTLMQCEAPEAWGRTKFREFHMGHLHSEHTKEHGGIIFRNLSSITGQDHWHSKKGYVGAIKKTQVFVWDKLEGLSEIIHVPILQ